MTATEYIILVDQNDQEIGLAEKMAAHQQNLCHRAFSVFIFREGDQGTELLLQQRAAGKYHSADLWTNTCCSHPRAGESVISAGERRLDEELGIQATLSTKGAFHYNAHFENGLSENEIDHVLVGSVPHDIVIHVNPAEVQATRWVTLAALQQEMSAQPERFTPWFAQALTLACQP